MTEKGKLSPTLIEGPNKFDEFQTEGKNQWDSQPLSELIKPVLGKTPRRSNPDYWEDGTIKWVTAKDISEAKTRRIYVTEEKMAEEGKEASNAPILPKGTVVVTARGTLGEVVQLGESMTFNQTCYGLVTNDKLLDDFLYYVWQYVFGQVRAASYGSVFDTITMKSFKDIKIPLPPLKTQHRIASILTAFDNKIETNNSINQLLEEMAQTILKSWFVDFEAYEEFKDSKLGKIPRRFEVSPLGDFVDITMGSSPASEYYNDVGKGLPFFQGCKEFGQHYPRIERWCSKPEKVAGEDDVIMSVRAPVGNLNRLMAKSCIGRGIAAFRMKKHTNEFLYYLLVAYKKRWDKYSSGTTYASVNSTDIREFPVIFPSDEEIERFNNAVRPMELIIKSNAKENRRLAKLRDTLLPKLMSGEIR